MTNSHSTYAELDRPDVSTRLFHPRKDPPHSPLGPGRDVTIPVSGDAQINGRFHWVQADGPTFLYFHGNGEIVSDYDDLGPIYNALGINLFVVDYRGYGRSSGNPSVSSMMQDCHTIFGYTLEWLQANQHTGPIMLMGRSLGSASVLELAGTHQDQIDGLIIESGFAYAEPLLRLLGIDPEAIGFKESEGFRNIDKIRSITRPTLIIHAEHDHIIPFSDGQVLFEASSAEDKRLVKIPEANHNDIFYRGHDIYLAAIRDFTSRVSNKNRPTG